MTANRHVLVIEDDDDIREILETILEFSDIMVIAFGDASHALGWLRAQRDHELPSLILLDLILPGMTGYDFRHCQLADPRLSEIPVIIVSASGRGESDRIMMGCSAYLRKPFDVPTLLGAIREAAAPVAEAIPTRAERPIRRG